jgi:hypothetical protein
MNIAASIYAWVDKLLGIERVDPPKEIDPEDDIFKQGEKNAKVNTQE